MRHGAFALCVLAGAPACHGSSDASPAPAASASPSPAATAAAPAALAVPLPPWAGQWWHVFDATGERSLVDGSVVARSDVLVFVGKSGRIDHKPAELQRADDKRVEWTLAGGPIRASLERIGENGASLTIRDGARPLVLAMRLESTDRAAELDATELRERPAPDACDRAARCCPVVVEHFKPGAACKLDDELGVPRDPDLCARFLHKAGALYDRQQQPVPDACK